MTLKTINIEDRIAAILDRDRGVPYTRVLEKYDLTPNQFSRAINRNLSYLIQNAPGNDKKVLEDIAKDEDKKRELFIMEDEFLQQQYLRIQGKITGEKQNKFHDGTLKHSKNIENIIYFALTYNNPKLASKNREEVIQEIKNLNVNLQNYFHNIGLSGVMTNGFEEGEQDSPLAVIKVFNKLYQEKTGDVSLFDLSQKIHLHEWDIGYHAPNKYWNDPDNVKKAMYHIFSEQNPDLVSKNRKKVIKGINKLPSKLWKYFCSIGLIGPMSKTYLEGKNRSPFAMIKVLDSIYREKTGDVSLFDLNHEIHLHEWETGYHVPHSYWRNKKNVEKAIYHILTEHHPALKSENRIEIIEEIKKSPTNLSEYFQSIGLGRLGKIMSKGFGNEEQYSPMAVLKVFDKIYQEKTGDVSLFDTKQKYYIEFNKQNRLIR